MQINQLRYVTAAAKYGSFSQAAKELFVTQPTLSQQIHALEEELGTRLFFRHSKSVSLTQAGKIFCDYACRVLNDSEEVFRKMKDFQNLECGRINLGICWIFSYLNLTSAIQAFEKRHPNIDLLLHLDGSNNLIEAVKRHDIDAAVCICPQKLQTDPELYSQLLQSDYIALMIHKSNPLSQSPGLTIRDLEGEKIILPAPDSPLNKKITALLQEEDVTVHIVCESSHNELNARMVSQNFAVSFSSESVAHALNSGVYSVVPFYPKIQRDVFFITPRYQLDTPAIQELIHLFHRNGLGNISLDELSVHESVQDTVKNRL